jgi:hypothetical protein
VARWLRNATPVPAVQSVMLGLLGLIVAIGILGSFVARRRRLQGRGERLRHALGPPLPSLDGAMDGDLVTIAGSLHLASGALVVTRVPAGADATDSLEPSARTTGAETRVELVVGTDSRGVLLEGPLQILVGSRESAPGTSLGAAARAIRHATDEGSPVASHGTLRALASGDAIRTRGILRRLPGHDARGYRGEAVAFALAAKADATWPARPLPLVFEGSPRPLGGGAGRIVAAFVTAGAIAFGIVSYRPTSGAVPWNPSPSWTTTHPSPSPCESVESSLRRGQPWQGAPSVDACDRDDLTARVRWLIGDFSEASKAYVRLTKTSRTRLPTLEEAEAHAIAGRYEEAARAVRALSDTSFGLGTPDHRRMSCIADALDAAGGDAMAPARLAATAAAVPTDPSAAYECALLAADRATDGAARVALPPTSNRSLARLRELLLAETLGDGAPTSSVLDGDVEQALRDPRAWLHLRPVALEAALVERPTIHASRQAYEADLALFYAYIGEPVRAKAGLGQILGRASPGPADPRALLLGSIAAAQAHDAEDLAALVHERHAGSDEVDRLRAGAEERTRRVKGWVDEPMREGCVTCGVFTLAETLADRRAEATRAGQTDLATTFGQLLVDHVVPALMDRKLAVILALLEQRDEE